MHILLTQAPPSLESLSLYADIRTAVDRDMVQNMFSDPAWKNLFLLRSLTLQILCESHIVSSLPLLCVSHGCLITPLGRFLRLRLCFLLTDLQSFTLDDIDPRGISPTVRRILHDKPRPSSSLAYADICGEVSVW